MPQSAIVNWLFSWKKPKATPRSVWDRFEPNVAVRERSEDSDKEWIASMRSQFEFDGHRIERLMDRVDELERDLRRLREEAGFA